MPLLQANKNSTWPSQHCWNLITLQWCKYTNMVIVHCTLNKQTWMIPHFDQRVTADAKMYHTWLYVKCTIIYDHVCTQFWRSVSASGHGNVKFDRLTRPTRVRIRPAVHPKWSLWPPVSRALFSESHIYQVGLSALTGRLLNWFSLLKWNVNPGFF